MTPETESTYSLETPAPVGVERRIFVLISIAIVAVMFLGMVGLLYWRERPAPSALLVMRVPPAEDGAIATVDAKFARDLSPIITTLRGGQEVRIPLPPGEYIVRIEQKTRRGVRADFVLSDYFYYPIIIQDPAATQPAGRGNSKK
ncbi:MAG TPA: hypothetical protein VGP99_08105 [Tepidisphaeraceae bacterium]|jgi:hypothetical protein|nr:hypothetical protein [Tepidisphaeraceae bacterium]